MNWPEISAAITALAGIYAGLRRIVKLQASSIRTIVKSECRSLAIDIENLEDRIKQIDSRLDSVMKVIGELKAHQASTRTALDRVHDEIHTAIQENTKALKDVQKSKLEWLTNELAVLKSKKAKGDK